MLTNLFWSSLDYVNDPFLTEIQILLDLKLLTASPLDLLTQAIGRSGGDRASNQVGS